MWHLPREIFDLATESLSKVRRLKNTEVVTEKKAKKSCFKNKEILPHKSC